MRRYEIGRYLVADPRVCEGGLCFRDTRILVADALYYLARGHTPEEVAAQWPGLVSPEAVQEAALLVGSGVIQELEIAA
jgi:uncharacterized protein (DUF433 family)